ncbi:hypothetical protein D3C87_1482790 [compost metagenome]
MHGVGITFPLEKRCSRTGFAFRPTRLAARRISSRVASVVSASSRDRSAGLHEILKNAATAASDASPASAFVVEEGLSKPVSISSLSLSGSAGTCKSA